MADEGEIDIEGDFDFKLEADGDIYDANELPSKSANLLPEYTNPPWMLEQGWTLDNGMDEKSKATIEKMLLEEQYYINGKASTRLSASKQRQKKESATSKSRRPASGGKSKCIPHVPPKQEKGSSQKRCWTSEEKQLFQKGLEIHGRSWTKIAELIPTRTSLQIKSFAHQHFKDKIKALDLPPKTAKTVDEALTMTTDPLLNILATVSTGLPTIPIRGLKAKGKALKSSTTNNNSMVPKSAKKRRTAKRPMRSLLGNVKANQKVLIEAKTRELPLENSVTVTADPQTSQHLNTVVTCADSGVVCDQIVDSTVECTTSADKLNVSGAVNTVQYLNAENGQKLNMVSTSSVGHSLTEVDCLEAVDSLITLSSHKDMVGHENRVIAVDHLTVVSSGEEVDNMTAVHSMDAMTSSTIDTCTLGEINEVDHMNINGLNVQLQVIDHVDNASLNDKNGSDAVSDLSSVSQVGNSNSKVSTVDTDTIVSNLPADVDGQLVRQPHLIENLETFCAVADIVTGSTGNESGSDDSEIDVENDDEIEENPILKSRSTSPNSVYERLLNESKTKRERSRNVTKIAHFIPSPTRTSTKIPASSKSVNYKAVPVSKTGTKALCDLSDVQSESQSSLQSSSDSGISMESISSHDTSERDDSKTESNRSAVEELERKKKGSNVDKDLHSEVGDRTVSPLSDVEFGTDSAGGETDGSLSEGDRKDMDKKKANTHLSQKLYVNAVVTCQGEIIELPVPKLEKYCDPKSISDEERRIHLEFFDGRPSKTPDRYRKIRNFIIESWKKSKPVYLNKTSVRPGLKNCGDVNCIGRIHTYLECTGAINFGCAQATYNHPGRVTIPGPREKIAKDTSNEISFAKLEAMRPRKRKIRDPLGRWVDEKDLEGKTIEHKDLPEQEVKPKIVRQPRTTYDPFKLVPCQAFTLENPPPFSVEIHSSALMVMDMHAHVSKTEVIGMLGGQYVEEQGKLRVTHAKPCRSLSTGMQCEMDPVSQTQASEEIRGAGMVVVGWYHSHPSFAPNPSVRDIETQLKFQDWFAKGGSNFVGIIISPYNPINPVLGSEIRCLTVGKDILEKEKCNVPYSFEYLNATYDMSDVDILVDVARKLSADYSTYRNRVDLLSTYRMSMGVSCLDKLIESMKQYCGTDADPELDQILHSVKTIFQEAFSSSKTLLDTDSGQSVSS